MEKEFGKLTREQARQLYAMLYELNQQISIFVQELVESEKLDKLVMPWAEWYELSYLEHIECLLNLFSLEQFLHEAVQNKDPQQAVIDTFIPGIIDNIDSETIDDDERQIVVSFFCSIMGQFQAIQQFSQPMSMLIEKARQGDMDALFRAIVVDRSVVACPSIAKQISMAQLRGDETFFDRLAKATTRTKPVRPKSEYDDLRSMLEIVLDGDELNKITSTQLESLLADDLELYSNSGDYSLRAFRKFLQKRDKMVGT